MFTLGYLPDLLEVCQHWPSMCTRSFCVVASLYCGDVAGRPGTFSQISRYNSAYSVHNKMADFPIDQSDWMFYTGTSPVHQPLMKPISSQTFDQISEELDKLRTWALHPGVPTWLTRSLPALTEHVHSIVLRCSITILWWRRGSSRYLFANFSV